MTGSYERMFSSTFAANITSTTSASV